MKQLWHKCYSCLAAALLTATVLVVVSGLLVGCTQGEEDSGGYVPPYITDLMVVNTDFDGRLVTVVLDDGSIYDVAAQQLQTKAINEKVRCRGTYTLSEGKMELLGLAAIFSSGPVAAESFVLTVDGKEYGGVEYLPRDPVKVISMWKSGGYINLHLGVMTSGEGVHQYAFCKEAPGHYSLVHLRPLSDKESYTEQVYMSMPIPAGVDELTFSVHTYDGICTRTF